MTYGEIKNIMENTVKGSFHNAKWSKELKTKKNCTDLIEQVTDAKNVRFGVDYSHMKAVKETHELDEKGNAIVQPLKWGEWKEFPYFIEHKDNLYIRLSCADNTAFKSEYYRNGVKVTKESILSDCLKSNFSSSEEKPTVLTIKTENIDYIK